MILFDAIKWGTLILTVILSACNIVLIGCTIWWALSNAELWGVAWYAGSITQFLGAIPLVIGNVIMDVIGKRHGWTFPHNRFIYLVIIFMLLQPVMVGIVEATVGLGEIHQHND